MTDLEIYPTDLSLLPQTLTAAGKVGTAADTSAQVVLDAAGLLAGIKYLAAMLRSTAGTANGLAEQLRSRGADAGDSAVHPVLDGLTADGAEPLDRETFDGIFHRLAAAKGWPGEYELGVMLRGYVQALDALRYLEARVRAYTRRLSASGL